MQFKSIVKVALEPQETEAECPLSPDAGYDFCSPDILYKAAPYLFAVVLEYSLIATTSFLIFVQEVCQPHHHIDFIRSMQHFVKVELNAPDMQSLIAEEGPKQNVPPRVAFGRSHVGTFLGLLVFGAAIFSIVMFYYHDSAEKNFIYLVTDLIIHSLMFIATVYTLIVTGKLAYIEKPASVDDLLLLVSMCGSFFYEASLIMAVSHHIAWNGGSTTELSLMLSGALIAGLQSVIQVVLIFSGLRRVSLSAKHLKMMPGRWCVAFLVVTNVTLWVTRTTQVKGLNLSAITKDVYGELTWLMIINISLPLLLFYRFHASVCLADVWITTYKPIPSSKFNKRINKNRPELDVRMENEQESITEDSVKAMDAVNEVFEDGLHF